MECPIAPKFHSADLQEDCHEEHCPSPRVGRGLTSPAWLSPPDLILLRVPFWHAPDVFSPLSHSRP
jgi:hypothetical protein